MELVIGVDIGQKRDPTAICVAELDERKVEARTEIHFLIRRLERLPLGTRYPRVADRVRDVVAGCRLRSPSSLALYVDATGVGKPVVDLLAEQIEGTRPTPVYFTHGDRRMADGIEEVKLGKAFMVSRLQALLQTGRLHLPPTSEAQVLAQELQDYEIRVDENANDRYGAFKVGTHDDLVTALGLAVQTDRSWGRSAAFRLR